MMLINFVHIPFIFETLFQYVFSAYFHKMAAIGYFGIVIFAKIDKVVVNGCVKYELVSQWCETQALACGAAETTSTPMFYRQYPVPTWCRSMEIV